MNGKIYAECENLMLRVNEGLYKKLFKSYTLSVFELCILDV